MSEQQSDFPLVWYQNIRSTLFGFVTKHVCNRQTDKQTDGRTELRHLILRYGAVKTNYWFVSGIDYCAPVSTYDTHKGEIHWSETAVGSRRIVRCPYAYLVPSYASHDCLLYGDNQTAQWTNLNDDRCPDPPFSRAVDLLYRSVVSRHGHVFFSRIFNIYLSHNNAYIVPLQARSQAMFVLV